MDMAFVPLTVIPHLKTTTHGLCDVASQKLLPLFKEESVLTFAELSPVWQRVFTLAWESVCAGSRAIGAVIANEAGNILSEGRNRTGELSVPNPKTAHAETEAVCGLDTQKHPDLRSYTLFAGLEPCVMCMGTCVMGGIRRFVIAAPDAFGGAMSLLSAHPFLAAKQVSVQWADPVLGDVQRGMQTIRELLQQKDEARLHEILTAFSECNPKGVAAARALADSGMFRGHVCRDFTAEQIVNGLLISAQSAEVTEQLRTPDF